ncbi:SOS response-associated peptidase [Undibacter mobilis]|uniref:Abasic site processing protein n=1 Tax=Undibacter mobilis TaxID=2292256 RepID=A0A371B4D2_9BRAD|nr:SOS response-associated peptidase [Undibacter mobilis]RDV02293.1 SOS response-associated peptidase [Undibacter mobilis]
MCGRYTLTASPQAIRDLFRYAEQPNFPPRYNIAPTQPIAVVCLVNRQRQFVLMRWGLLPSWVKDPKAFSLIVNARGESVIDKPSFRAAMKRRRCLIPADGFYEWRAGGPRKQPYFIHARSGAPLAFAGLWETWTGPNGEELDTVTIVTTEANSTVRPLHDRMPVIVPPEAFGLWLDTDNVDAATASSLIMPAPDDLLEVWPVSTDVNRVANDNAQLIERVAESTEPAPSPKVAAAKKSKATKPKDDGQGVLF